jgi:hypothetical protein
LWATFNEQLIAKADAAGDAEQIGIVERVLQKALTAKGESPCIGAGDWRKYGC